MQPFERDRLAPVGEQDRDAQARFEGAFLSIAGRTPREVYEYKTSLGDHTPYLKKVTCDHPVIDTSYSHSV